MRHSRAFAIALLALTAVLWGGVHRVEGAPPVQDSAGGGLFPALVPLGGSGGVVLHALAVDIYLGYEPLQADFSATYRFSNPDPRNAKEVSVQIRPGSAGTGELFLRSGGSESPVSPGGTFKLALSPSSKKDVTLRGSLPLEGYPLVEVAYALAPATLWAGAISSVRVTVHFPRLTTQDEWVLVSPAPAEFDGFRLTWRFEGSEPSDLLRISLVHPDLWARITSLARKAAQGRASAQELYELGAAYRTLALALDPGDEAFEGFFRQAVAYLEQARNLDPSLAQASVDIAALYRQRAFLPDGTVDASYVALSIRELERAIAAGASEQSFGWSLQELYVVMGQELEKAGRFDEAIGYYEKAMSLLEKGIPLPYDAPRLEAMLRDTRARQAAKLLEQGRYHEALALLRERLGADFLGRLGFQMPLCRSARALVRMQANEREVFCSCVPGPLFVSGNPALEPLRELPQGAEFTDEGGRLVLKARIPFDSAEELKSRMKEIARYIPVRSDFGPCLVAFAGEGLTWGQEPEFLGQKLAFSERLDMAAVEALLDVDVAGVRRRCRQLQGTEVFESPALQELAVELCRVAEEEWQSLRGDLTLEYELLLGGVKQSWFLKPGDSITLERELWEPYPWVKPAIGLVATAVGVILLALLLRFFSQGESAVQDG